MLKKITTATSAVIDKIASVYQGSDCKGYQQATLQFLECMRFWTNTNEWPRIDFKTGIDLCMATPDLGDCLHHFALVEIWLHYN